MLIKTCSKALGFTGSGTQHPRFSNISEVDFFSFYKKGGLLSTWWATCSCYQCKVLCNSLGLNPSQRVWPSHARRYCSDPGRLQRCPGFQSYSQQPPLTTHSSQPRQHLANAPHLRALMDYWVCGSLPPAVMVRDSIHICFLKSTLKIHVIASPFASCGSHLTALRENWTRSKKNKKGL